MIINRESLKMSQNVLVFSIALNGYQWLYRDCLSSHSAYANRHGYHYCVVSRPIATALGVECCWLKLTLMLEALNSGYDLVLFVDADAYINESTPSLHSAVMPNKFLYMAKSYTRRFNSGVILGKNCFKLREWLQTVIASQNTTILTENDVGWGENGHIIQFSKDCTFLSTLDRRWNNTYDPELTDYIRHFSFGPLRKNWRLNVCHKILSRISRLWAKGQGLLNIHSKFSSNDTKLNVLTKKVLTNYPCFTRI